MGIRKESLSLRILNMSMFSYVVLRNFQNMKTLLIFTVHIKTGVQKQCKEVCRIFFPNQRVLVEKLNTSLQIEK